ncbi:MAG: FecR family protein [Chitinophagaceae bacterium]|nr:FecR family protein [Chitinophagaceae bacterium]
MTPDLNTLLDKYATHSITDDERQLLFQLIATGEQDEAIALILDQQLAGGIYAAPGDEMLKEQLFQGIVTSDRYTNAKISEPRVRHLRTTRFRYTAAAIFILFAAGIYLWSINKGHHPETRQIEPGVVKNDVLPGSNKAMLTLSNGQHIVLDEAKNGQLAKDGGAVVVKSADGQVLYRPAADRNDEAMLNTMTTPRGGQYQLTLPDGSKAWLNAASSITYPTKFNKATREISITGEAYFEIFPDKEKPFIVRSRLGDIKVLGTRFNINSYDDEPDTKATLAEGAVQVNGILLRPGQAYVHGKVVPTDVGQDIAWKNGVFNFNNVTVQQAMRQIARWYNIEIVYDETINEEFIGEIGRGLSLAEVLKTMDGAGVHFKLEGNTLHISR